MDTQTSKEEARNRAALTNEEPRFDEMLYLYKLSGQVKTIHDLQRNKQFKEVHWEDIPHLNTCGLESLVPKLPRDVMLCFLYKDIERQFDKMTFNLYIFGNRLFHFSSNYAFLHPEKVELN